MRLSLGNFGIEHCDLPTMISNVDYMLRLAALDIDHRNAKPIATASYLVTFMLSGCYIYVYIISMVWFVFVECGRTGDVLSALIVFSLGVASEIAATKFVYLLLCRRRVRKIVEEFLACDALPSLNKRYTENLLDSLKKVKKRAMIFWITIYGNCLLYIIKPIVTPGRHTMEDFFTLYGLEPMFETPNYEIAWFTLLASTVFIGHLTSNITAFHIVITGYVEAQMVSLGKELEHLWEDIQKEHGKVEIINEKSLEDAVKERLTQIAKRHAVTMHLHKELEDLFQGAIAVEFLLLVLALIAELLGGLRNTYMEVPFALMLVATDCWSGQRVADASNTFEASVYDSKWEYFNKENMRTVYLMELMSQRTLKMSAGTVATLDLACFMAINKYIYSTYTTLASVMN